MNKKLIAMAIGAAMAAPLAAHAEPTVYGNLQVEIANYDDGKNSTADDNKGTPASGHMATDDNKRGRLGVKGSEDLGNGMSAIYNFEWQVETTQGQVDDGARVGMVGLKGGFGTIEAGALKQPYKYTGGVKYDPFVTTYLEARSRGGMSGKSADGGFLSGSAGHHAFMTDAVAYKNKFGPVELWVATSLDENGGAKGNDGDINASVKFGGKDFEVFVAMASYDGVYAKTSSYAATGDTAGQKTGSKAVYSDATYDAMKFGGMYKMGAHKIKLQIESTEAKTAKTTTTCTGTAILAADCTAATAVASTAKVEADFMFLGYELAMGKNVIAFNYGTADFANVADVDYLALGLIHKFSKTTRAFVGTSTSKSTPKTGGTSTDAAATSIGLRVDF